MARYEDLPDFSDDNLREDATFVNSLGPTSSIVLAQGLKDYESRDQIKTIGKVYQSAIFDPKHGHGIVINCRHDKEGFGNSLGPHSKSFGFKGCAKLVQGLGTFISHSCARSLKKMFVDLGG